MVKRWSILSVLAFLAVSACTRQTSEEPEFRSYDLMVSHPSPYATFIALAPGSQGAKLPRLSHLNSRDFNRYLVALIGCSVDPRRETHVIGDKRVPAGYMVPISCV